MAVPCIEALEGCIDILLVETQPWDQAQSLLGTGLDGEIKNFSPQKLAPVAESGSYNDLADRPAIPPAGIWKNVREMFDIPTTADVRVLMADPGEGEKPMIWISGVDTSGESNPLVITPQLGFGSYYDRVADNAILVRGLVGGVATDFRIDVAAEVGSIPSTITIPAECSYFDIRYFVGKNNATYRSFWYDNQGAAHPFNAGNTPIENFSHSSEGSVVINGKTVPVSDIFGIDFGESYRPITTLPFNFLRTFVNLRWLNVTTFSNVKTLSDGCFMGLYSIDLIEGFEISETMTGIENIGAECFVGFPRRIIRLDLMFPNLKAVGNYFFADNPYVGQVYVGGIDWNYVDTTGVGAFLGLPNDSSVAIYAHNMAEAEAFKGCFPQCSNWRVEVY